MKKIGIIGAMDIEIELLRSNMKLLDRSEKITFTQTSELSFAEGSILGTPVVIVKSGIGKVNAALCAQQLITLFGVTAIINTGIAGAIASNLNVLDMVVSTDALYHDFDVTGFGYKATVIPQMAVSVFKADQKMVEAAIHAYNNIEEISNLLGINKKSISVFSEHKLVAGRIASGDQFVSSQSQKKHIKELCQPSCVEMEGAAIAHTCYLNNTPFAIIRCISDMADDGEESTYKFNEKTAGEMSALVVMGMLKLL